MSPEMQQLVATIKTAENPFTLMFLALLVGAIVRVLKTKKAGDLLDALPLTKRIPKDVLPWCAVFVAFVLATLDAKINAKLGWYPSLVAGVVGAMLSGGTAIGGNETVAKLFKAILAGGSGSSSSDAPPKDDGPKMNGSQRRALRIAGVVAMLLVALWLQACAMFKDPKTATQSVLSIADLVCIETGDGAMITDAKEAMVACKMIKQLKDAAPDMVDIVTKLIGQREAGKRAGFNWQPPGVVETVTKDAGVKDASHD